MTVLCYTVFSDKQTHDHSIGARYAAKALTEPNLLWKPSLELEFGSNTVVIGQALLRKIVVSLKMSVV